METTTKVNKMQFLACGHFSEKYGYFEGKKLCYACCAELDKKQMCETGKIMLYLSMSGDAYTNNGNSLTRPIPSRHKVTNWSGTIEIPVHGIKTGRHNIAGIRFDFWFTFEGEEWWGVQYGTNTQCATCKKLKQKESTK